MNGGRKQRQERRNEEGQRKRRLYIGEAHTDPCGGGARAVHPNLRLAWCGVLALLLACAGWDAWQRVSRSLDLSSAYGHAVHAPEPEPYSRTGYNLERRSLVPPIFAPDSLHWVMQTQAAADEGGQTFVVLT